MMYMYNVHVLPCHAFDFHVYFLQSVCSVKHTCMFSVLYMCLSFDIESVSDEGGVSGVDSEPDRHQPLPNSLSLAIPDICTGT